MMNPTTIYLSSGLTPPQNIMLASGPPTQPAGGAAAILIGL